MMIPGPVFVLLSGKRKSGKDYCANKLTELLTAKGLKVGNEGVSVSLKKAYAKENPGVNYQELLTDGPYKEEHREKMIAWGEEIREGDPGYFCRNVYATACSSQTDVFLVPDCRRPTDFEYFYKRNCRVVNVRIVVREEVRKERGWTFTQGIDNAKSECALDDWNIFDVYIDNSGQPLEDQLNKLVGQIVERLPSEVISDIKKTK